MRETMFFEAPIRAVGYQRAMTDSRGRKRIKPAATRRCMQVIKLAAQVAVRHRVPSGTWVHVMVHVHYSTAVRPDLDNAVKTVLDALTGVAYEDDRQVEEIQAKVFQCDRDYLGVSVFEGGPMRGTPPRKRASIKRVAKPCQESEIRTDDDL